MGELLENFFRPLFEVVIDPETDPVLFDFLFNVSGFDSVDDESILDVPLMSCASDPFEWTSEMEPPYSYWLFFLNANIMTLNALISERRMEPFCLRPHAGATGGESHLVAAYLLADSIPHGV